MGNGGQQICYVDPYYPYLAHHLLLHVSVMRLYVRRCHVWVGQKRRSDLSNFRSKRDSEHIGLAVARQLD